jgi:hypothetical protein
MIQKHEMTADFEKLTYDATMLREAWKGALESARLLVNSKWTSYHILNFINGIIDGSPYAGILFPGFSVGKLLISKPINGKLNYQQTLAISYDNQTDLFTLQYSDWDLIDSPDEFDKAIQWAVKCPGTELIMHFQEFLQWKNNWN